MNNWATHLLTFYKNLKPPSTVPEGVEWLYPQKSPEVMQVVSKFLNRFYSDDKPRTLMLGINPGRFGAGITGVNFTGARQLKQDCDIDHPFKDGSELSAEFIYDMIRAYGGPEKFYSNFFIGSVSPLGFVKNGKNLNYYDDKELQRSVEPFIIDNLKKLVKARINREVCYCIGGEKNYKYLSLLNKEYKWFEQIIALPHPRFIMQYRRKQKTHFIQEYLRLLRKE